MFARALTFVVMLGLVTSALTAQQPPAESQAGRNSAFVPEEATISDIHAALGAGRITCVQLVQAYLRRIEAYDDRGPALNAIITVNARALETAADLDRVYAASRSNVRPLHCIPVIVKDNYDTADMPTTGGSRTLAASVPLRDGFVVRRLRDAGAIILAKANLTELARGGTTVSSLGGQTRNPYDLTRTPGGSSGAKRSPVEQHRVSCDYVPWRFLAAYWIRAAGRACWHRIVGSGVERAGAHRIRVRF